MGPRLQALWDVVDRFEIEIACRTVSTLCSHNIRSAGSVTIRGQAVLHPNFLITID